jgi:HEAT repeat protein
MRRQTKSPAKSPVAPPRLPRNVGVYAPRRGANKVVDVEERPRVLGMPLVAVVAGTVLLGVLAASLTYAAAKPEREKRRPVAAAASAAVAGAAAEAAPAERKSGSSRGSAATDGRARLADPEQFQGNVVLVLERLNPADERDVYRTLERYEVGGGKPRENADRLVAVLTKLVGDDDVRVRRGAIALLARIAPDVLITDPFSGALCDEDAGVRREAVIGRARHGMSRHWPSVMPLARDEDPSVRIAAAQALASVARDETRATLLKLLADSSDDVVEAAAEAVARGARDVAPPEALAAVRSDRPRVRAAAIHVLAAAHGPKCLDPIVSLLDDPADEVRRQAIRSLPRFTGEQAKAACEQLVAVASSARRPATDRFEALQALSRTAVAPAPDAIHGVATSAAEPFVRLAAARTLLGLRDSRACAILAELAGTKASPACHYQVAEFVSANASATLRAMDAAKPAGDDPAAWRPLVASLETAVRRDGFTYRPEPLTLRW